MYTVYTDHSAVKAVLETPNPSSKHARWWTKVYGQGVKKVEIRYRLGKSNTNADALSRSPQAQAPREGLGEGEIQVAVIDSSEEEATVMDLMSREPVSTPPAEFGEEQRKDPHLMELIHFLEDGKLPSDEHRARKLALQEPMFEVMDTTLYRLDPKGGRKQVVVPEQLKRRGWMSGHFSGHHLFNTLSWRWWWKGMYRDARDYARSCPECAVVAGGGRVNALHSTPYLFPDRFRFSESTSWNYLVLTRAMGLFSCCKTYSPSGQWCSRCQTRKHSG